MGTADGAGPVEDEDPVGAGRRRDAVGHDDEGAGAVRKGPFGSLLGSRVQVAGGLVEQQQRSGREVGGGQREVLALAPGQLPGDTSPSSPPSRATSASSPRTRTACRTRSSPGPGVPGAEARWVRFSRTVPLNT